MMQTDINLWPEQLNLKPWKHMEHAFKKDDPVSTQQKHGVDKLPFEYQRKQTTMKGESCSDLFWYKNNFTNTHESFSINIKRDMKDGGTLAL